MTDRPVKGVIGSGAVGDGPSAFRSLDRIAYGRFIPCVAFEKPDFREGIQVGSITGEQVVQNRYFVTVVQQLPHKVGANKSSAAGYKRS
jgi:hypothetical protein